MQASRQVDQRGGQTFVQDAWACCGDDAHGHKLAPMDAPMVVLIQFPALSAAVAVACQGEDALATCC